MGDPEWNKRLIPIFKKAVTYSSGDLPPLLDSLLSKRLLGTNKYKKMIQTLKDETKDEEVARDLLLELMERPAPSFGEFVNVLEENVEGNPGSSCKHLLKLLKDVDAVQPSKATITKASSNCRDPSESSSLLTAVERKGARSPSQTIDEPLSKMPSATETRLRTTDDHLQSIQGKSSSRTPPSSPPPTAIDQQQARSPSNSIDESSLNLSCAKETQLRPTEDPLQSQQSNIQAQIVATGETSFTDANEAPDLPVPNVVDRAELNIRSRDYQLSLASIGQSGRNSIVISDTGSGKTLVAGLVYQSLWNRNATKRKRSKGVLLVPENTLVAQQEEQFKSYLKGPKIGSVQAKSGSSLRRHFKMFDFMTMTGGLFLAFLENDPRLVEEISLIVLDECHHANHKTGHPYTKIMEKCLAKKETDSKLPLILGLTASPGTGKTDNVHKAIDHLINLCALLNAEYVTVYGNNDIEKLTEVLSAPARDPDVVIKLIAGAMNNLERKLDPEVQCLQPNVRPPGTQQYEIFATNVREEGRMREDGRVQVTGDVLWKMNCALEIYEDMNVSCAVDHLQKELARTNFGRRSQEVRDCYERLLTQLRTIDITSLKFSPKLGKLKEELMKVFRTDSESKVILFVRTRASTQSFSKFVEEDSDLVSLVKPATITGIGQEEKLLMTHSKQDDALEMFRSGGCNLLICTSTAEAGLDIPECNAVIRYEHVRNEISHVQMAGRARARASRRILIVTADSGEEHREHRNLGRLDVMREAIEAIQSMDEAELKKRIKEKQRGLLTTISPGAPGSSKRTNVTAPDISSMTVHCSFADCETALCTLGDVRAERSHILVMKKDFIDKVDVRKKTEEEMKSSASKSDPGTERTKRLYCKSCKNKKVGTMVYFETLKKEIPAITCREIRLKTADGKPMKAYKKWIQHQNKLDFEFENYKH